MKLSHNAAVSFTKNPFCQTQIPVAEQSVQDHEKYQQTTSANKVKQQKM